MAKQKYSPNDIQNKTEDWGMDVNDVEKRPFSGASVQKFIKRTFDGKIGYLHYDTGNNRYVAFADEESRDAYLEDPTRTDLILGTFDAPFNFTASITLISSQNSVLTKGATGNYIEYTFDITDKSGASTMESVNVKYTFMSGGLRKTVSAQYAYGTKVSFLADDYLGDGETIVQIAIVGHDTLAATTRSVSFRVLDLSLSSDYNIGTVNDVLANPYIQVPFSVTSSRHVILKASVDYGAYETVMETDTYITNGAHQIDTLNLSEGKHNVRLMAQNIIDGVTYSSDVVYKDFIVSRGAIAERLVLFEGVIPRGVEDTGFKLYGVKKYIPFNVTLAAYNPAASRSEVMVDIVNAGKVYSVGQKVLPNGESETITFTPVVSGASVLRAKNGETTEEVPASIETSSVQIEEITNQLELALRAMGRSNNDAGKESWTYGEYKTVFSGFGWNARSGWVNNALKISAGASVSINIAPLSFNPETSGFTFEMEFSTELVNDEDAVVMDLTENGTGLRITASEASLVSGNGRSVSTRFRAGESHRIAFVIDNTPIRNSKLAYIYVDGVRSGVIDFLSSDTFKVSKRMKVGGVQNAVMNLSDVRVYRRALSGSEILNNYMLYKSTADEMLDVYNRNDVMTDGKIDYEKVANQLPVMIVTGDIPILENTTNKKERIIVNVRYIDRQNAELCFNMTNAVMTPQGTSSMYYPKKNFRLYTQKNDNTELRVGSGEFGEGTLVESRLYAFRSGAQPVHTWCFKADYAESSSTHNTGVARLWNDALANMQVTVDGVPQYVGRTKAQQAAIDNGYEYDVRTTIDGFPIAMFYHQTEEDPLIFLGKYNFNNDKSTESVFGFKDIPGFDNSRMQCWEQLDSGNPYGLFAGDPEGFDDNWADAFEGRYPDANEDTTDLKSFYTWVYSCRDNQSKFDGEWKEHIDPYKMAAYYVYLMRFGGVDQVAKNAMLTSEDGVRWFFINYDNDTIFGLDNDGLLKYFWNILRNTKIEGTDVYCYAGHDSSLWNLLEACEEFMNLVPVVDQALYSARKGTKDVGLSFDNVIRMFNVEQASRWCETIYNEDSNYKYINPYRNNSVNQLAKLQGRRSSHRAWWVRNRWNLFDGKWMTGEFRKEGVTFKCQQGDAGTTMRITAGNDMYYGIRVQTTMIQSKELKAGESYDFAIDRPLQIGTPVSISNPANISGLDISNFAENISSLDIQKVKNSAGESRLKRLVLGKDGVTNNFLGTISGIENAYSLQEIDISGFRLITSLDLSQQTELQSVSALRSGLKEVSLPEGASIKTLKLPNTVQVLRLKDYPLLSSSGLVLEDNGSAVYSLSIIKCPKLSNVIDSSLSWLDNKATEDSGCTLYVDNIAWKDVEPETFLKFCAAKTNGMNLTLKGKVRLTTTSQETIDAITAAFGADVFDPANELYISAPDAIYMSGPDSIAEGESAQFVAVVFSDHKGTIRYSISSGSRDGVSIDRKTGLLTSVENGVGDATLTIRALHSPTSGSHVYIDKTLKVNNRFYPSTVTIEGKSRLESESQVYMRGTYDSNGDYYCVWELSGDITGYYEIESSNNERCVLHRTASASGLAEGTLTLTIKKKLDDSAVATATQSVAVMPEGVIMTKSTNAPVLECFYKAGLCANEGYMTKEEAEAVSGDKLNPDGSNSGSIFNSNGEKIKHFEEFAYFLGVSEIKAYTFSKCINLEAITLPETLVTIKGYAFYFGYPYNRVLREVIIPKSVATIERYAFTSGALETFRILGATTLEGNALAYDYFNTNLHIKSLYIAKGCTLKGGAPGIPNMEITLEGHVNYGGYGFGDTPITVNILDFNDYLENSRWYGTHTSILSSRGKLNIQINGKPFDGVLTIPSDITSFKGTPFYGCYTLTKVVSHPGITELPDFSGCSSLEEIQFGGDETKLGSLKNCGFKNIDIPERIVDLPDGCFQNNKNLLSASVRFGRTYEFFDGCTSLERVLFTGGTGEEISTRTFRNCSSLKSVNIPDSVRYINDDAFSGCSSLTSITLPSRVEVINSSAFQKCSSLTSVNIPNKVYDIDTLAFADCGNLEINVEESNRYYSSIDGVLFNKEKTQLICYAKDKKQPVYNIPDDVKYIGQYAFYACKSLTSVSIPGGVTSISNYAFLSCSSLAEIKVKATAAPNVSSSTFGYANDNDTCTGRNNYDKGTNVLYVPAGATGYDASYWADPLCNAEKCGFTISYTL